MRRMGLETAASDAVVAQTTEVLTRRILSAPTPPKRSSTPPKPSSTMNMRRVSAPARFFGAIQKRSADWEGNNLLIGRSGYLMGLTGMN